MKCTHWLPIAVLTIALAWPAAALAEELAASSWPQFKRDAARTGDHPTAVLKFPLQRVTAIRFPAPIYASPAVVDGLVYIQDAQGHFACIDSAKNRVVWSAQLGGFNNTSSPAVAAGKVYVGSTAGQLHIFDAKTGRAIKQVPAKGAVIAAPAVTEQGIYFSSLDGQLTKITPDGEVVWTYDGGRISPVDFAVRGRRILFFAGSNNTVFHELEDAGDKVAVVRKTDAPGQCCPVGGPTLIDEEDFVFQAFDSEYGRFHRFHEKSRVFVNDLNDSRVVASVRGDRVYRGDKCLAGPKLTQQWRAEPSVLYDSGFHSSPALGQDVLAIGSELGKVYFFALEGKGRVKPVWEFAISNAGQPNGAVSSSPALVDGQVFFGGEDGILYGLGQGAEAAVVDAPFARQVRQRTKLTGPEWPTVGGDMGLSGVSPDTTIAPPFQPSWKTRVWSSFKCPMIVADGMVFCTGRGGTLTVLDAAGGEILWKTHHAGVESRPPVTFSDGKLVLMRIRNAQGDSPYTSGGSGGPPGEGLWCHDAATGKLLWHRPMALRYHFNHDGLVTHDGKVFVVRLDDQKKPVAAAYALKDGQEVWKLPLEERLGDAKPAPKTSSVRTLSGLPPRFSGVAAEGLWIVSVENRITLGLRPADGSVAWNNPEYAIYNRSRLSARRGIVLVPTPEGGRALDARTGKLLWTDRAGPTGYSQALTDLYLDSQGQKGFFPKQHCSWPVWINGLFYSHERSASNNNLLALRDEDLTRVWSHSFLSNACPSPSPAYGRLYYSPNSEGVIYCFVNRGKP